MSALVPRLRAAGCVFAEEEADVLLSSARSEDELEAMVVRRIAGEPLEHVVGWVDFAGVRVAIEPGVFIPRQRTALMVERAAACLHGAATVLDLGCGSGALGLALASRLPPGAVTLHAVDTDPAAVACARRNLADVPGTVHRGDLTDPLPGELEGHVDAILANMPYVPTSAISTMPVDSRDHEPAATVDGGPDGLDLVRRVARLSATWLAPGGSTWVEVGEDQVEAATAAFRDATLTPTVHTDEERGATVVRALR
jgi:release factor glutamine methyltransferase